MIRAVRIVDSEDFSYEAVASDVVPRSLPSFSSSVMSASGVTVDRTGKGDLTHLKCIVDSPVITLSETSYNQNDEPMSFSLRIPNSTICNAKICVDMESRHIALLLISNVSVHWLIWRVPSSDSEKLLSGFPVNDTTTIFLPHRSFLFGSLITDASVTLSSASLIPSSVEPLAFFAIAFDNARVLFIRAPAITGSESTNLEHSFIEPTSLLSRLISLASSASQNQTIVSAGTLLNGEQCGAFVLRSTQSLELYHISSKRRLASCASGPATFSCSGSPLLARVIESKSGNFIGVLHRDSMSLKLTITKALLTPKLILSPTSEINFPHYSPNMSIIDAGVLNNCVFLACQKNDGTPVCTVLPSNFDGDTVEISGNSSDIQYLRRPLTYSANEDLSWEAEAESLTNSVLSADCCSIQLLRQLLQTLRLPHMGVISSNVVASGIFAALSARQTITADLNATGISESSNNRSAIESLSRKVETIWSKDRNVLGVHVCSQLNIALIYHRYSVTAILPAPLLVSADVYNLNLIESQEMFEKVATQFYNSIISGSEGANLSMFSSADAVTEYAASFLLTLDDELRYSVESSQLTDFEANMDAILSKSNLSENCQSKRICCRLESLNEALNSIFYRRVIARLILTNLDWLLSNTMALIGLGLGDNDHQVERLARYAIVLKSLRTIFESPAPIEEDSVEDIPNNSSFPCLADSFVEYSLSSSSILSSSVGDDSLSVTLLGNLLTKLLLPQNASFLVEQFLLDSSLFSEFEVLQKAIGAVADFPSSGYRLYLYGLSCLLRYQPTTALEYFLDAALALDHTDSALLVERCRPHISRIEKPEADFWVRILDLSQQFECSEIAVEAAVRAKQFFTDEESNADLMSFSRVLDMKLFRLQCQSFNFRGAIATLLNMSEEEDQVAAVNVIVTTAVAERKLSEITDCLLIEMSSFVDEKIDTLVSTALHRGLRSEEYPNWSISWALYRINLSKNSLRNAAHAVFEYYARLPCLSTLTPAVFKLRRDALALTYCTLQMLPPGEQWLTSSALRSTDSSEIVVTLQQIDELCRIEDARVELISACEPPEIESDMDYDQQMAAKSVALDGKQRPKFEEAAPIILRLGAGDLIRWLSTAELFEAATELCRAIQQPCLDMSSSLIEALSSKLDSNYNLVHESELRLSLLRLNDPRPTIFTVNTLYSADMELPGWLWTLAIRKDPEALLRASIKHKRLLEAGRISVIILEKALNEESSMCAKAHCCNLPWRNLDRTFGALSEFVSHPSSEAGDGIHEIVDCHKRLKSLIHRYTQHAQNVKRLTRSALSEITQFY